MMGEPEFVGKMPRRKDVEVIPSEHPENFPQIKILSDSDPIEEFDSWAGQFKGTTKIDNTLWGVIEIDPTKYKCNGKWMTAEEMSKALWDGTWHLESDKMILHGRRHLTSYIINKNIGGIK